MKVLQGSSTAVDAATAVMVATIDWSSDLRPEIVFAFVSTKQDANAVAVELSTRFPGAVIAGCTTSGEHLGGEHLHGSVVLTAVLDSGIAWSSTVMEGLATIDHERAEAATRKLFDGIGHAPSDHDPREYFCLSFIDGLRACEENVTATIAEALEGVRLAGGSAGDDLRFEETRVIAGDRAMSDAVVLVLGRAKGRFDIFKHQHFTPTRKRMAVTKVDLAGRRILELDGRPAVETYARALSLAPSEFTEAIAFSNPVALSCNGETFIRSPQKIHDDGSVSFFCGVEEGAVLEIAAHDELPEALEADIGVRIGSEGPFELMLGFNCILRAIEAEKQGTEQRVAAAWQQAARVAIGFDTYGEQLDGLHINQTLVAIGIRSAS